MCICRSKQAALSRQRTWRRGPRVAYEAVYGTLRSFCVTDHPLHLRHLRDAALSLGVAVQHRQGSTQQTKHRITSSALVTSAEKVCILVAVSPLAAAVICALAASNLACDRATSETSAPCFASSSAMACPIPVDPPVISTCLSLKLTLFFRNRPIGTTTTAATVSAIGSRTIICGLDCSSIAMLCNDDLTQHYHEPMNHGGHLTVESRRSRRSQSPRPVFVDVDGKSYMPDRGAADIAHYCARASASSKLAWHERSTGRRVQRSLGPHSRTKAACRCSEVLAGDSVAPELPRRLQADIC